MQGLERCSRRCEVLLFCTLDDARSLCLSTMRWLCGLTTMRWLCSYRRCDGFVDSRRCEVWYTHKGQHNTENFTFSPDPDRQLLCWWDTIGMLIHLLYNHTLCTQYTIIQHTNHYSQGAHGYTNIVTTRLLHYHTATSTTGRQCITNDTFVC